MNGFKNTTKMVSGHNMSSAGQTVGRVASFARGGRVFARGGTVRDKIGGEHEPQKKIHSSDGEVTGLDESWEHEAKEKPDGNALVQREGPQVSEELEEGGGRSPLRAGFAKGGKSKSEFHVHNHYHNGKRLPSKNKLKKMEMQAKKEATGGTINKVKGGGSIKRSGHDKKGFLGEKKTHKAEGGPVFPEARDPDGYGDYATGGTINELNAGGGAYGGMATGGTINPLAVGGMPQRPVMAGGPPQGALGAMAARGRPMPQPQRPMPRQAMPMQQQAAMPVAGPRPVMRARGGSITRATGGRSGRGGY
jgi:hypothetical protein